MLIACNLTQVHMKCLSLQLFMVRVHMLCTCVSTGTCCSLVMKPFCEKVRVLFLPVGGAWILL